MTERHFSRHQQDIIRNYYENADAISLQKLQEIVTDLYLADSPAQKQRLWDRAKRAMTQFKVPPKLMAHILAQKNVEVLAYNVQDWLKAAGKKK
jgi:hypothetical protein